ncbi:uncharacterized protein [Typha angustifolia]|uniref:uncharacterized protein isoform X2 n=1 Tax=Typha angustifolia TaxID=59011 RepID=UPI003C2D9A49
MSEPNMAELSPSSKQQTKDVKQMNNPPPSPRQETESDPLEEKRKELFKLAMRGEWEEVIKIYKANPEVQDQRLTRAKGTTLHVAISAGKEDVALRLLAAVSTDNVKKILETKNDTESTPLHVAASHGMHRACWKMAECCPKLVTSERNRHGETPLFTAVRHGKKEAFFALEWWVQNVNPPTKDVRRDVTHCRREKDGNNILHFAILGEYFGLANEIIGVYPELVNYVNTVGESPLHYLAKKPLCFKSGTRFGLYDQLIYSCIFIGQHERKFLEYTNRKSYQRKESKSDKQLLPETFNTFSHLFTLLKPLLQIVTKMPGWIPVPEWIRRRCGKGDEENLAENSETEEDIELPFRKFPEIYDVGVALFTAVMKVILVIMGIGLWRTHALERIKRKNIYALQLMNELVDNCKDWEYEKDGKNPHLPRSSDALPDKPPQEDNEHSPTKDVTATTKESSDGKSKGEDGHQVNVYIKICKDEQKGEESTKPVKATPMLVAAKNGITEIVKKILETFPVAILDVDENDKNIVLLAVEYRQTHIYELMLAIETMKDSVFGKIDKDGNSALHFAAMLSQKLPWSIPGVALQMQWEIKWYKYVMRTVGSVISHTYNNKGQTAQELFIDNHKDLVKDAGDWLVKTSESCSVVAALIAGVAFASAATVPGGVNQSSGEPILSGDTTFQVFAFSSLVALCFSVTSLIMFLTILTSRYQEEDFNKSLPTKLLIGLTSLFTSIAAMLVSFCAGDFFVVQKQLKFAAFPIYAVMLLPVSFFAIAQLPLYVDLIRATAAIVPERTQKMQTF